MNMILMIAALLAAYFLGLLTHVVYRRTHCHGGIDVNADGSLKGLVIDVPWDELPSKKYITIKIDQFRNNYTPYNEAK